MVEEKPNLKLYTEVVIDGKKVKIRRTLEEGKVIPAIHDLLFKKIYGDIKCKERLEVLLGGIIDNKLTIESIHTGDIVGDNYKSKKYSTDIICRLSNGEIVSVEVNSNIDKYDIKRNLTYLSRIISNDLEPGEKFTKYVKYYQINLNDKSIGNMPISRYVLKNRTTNEELTEFVEIINVDVYYYKNLCYTKSISDLKLLDIYIGILGMENKNDIEKLQVTNNIIKGIGDSIMDYSKNEKFIVDYNQDEYIKNKYKWREEDAEERGVEKGIKQNQSKIVLAMLKENIDKEVIVRITGLSIDEIDILKDKN